MRRRRRPSRVWTWRGASTTLACTAASGADRSLLRATPTATLAAALSDELDALAAIFDHELLIERGAGGGGAVLRVSGRRGGAALTVLPDYAATPGAAPTVAVEGLRRGDAAAVVDAVAAVLTAARGEPCLFQMINTLRDAVGAGVEDDAAAALDAAAEAAAAAAAAAVISSAAAAPRYPVYHGPLVVERKSTFQAHVARVAGAGDVAAALAAVHASSPRIARATHNMFAFRYLTAAGGAVADNDDDGEDAAGGRLAALLELTGASGVLVVVSRWFGGVLLGPSRFAVICNVARAALADAGFCDVRRA